MCRRDRAAVRAGCPWPLWRRRLAAARRYARVDGIGTECGWGRKSPDKIPALLDQHRHMVENI
jgi:hypothetical protein